MHPSTCQQALSRNQAMENSGSAAALGCCPARPRAGHERTGRTEWSVPVARWSGARPAAPEAGAIPEPTASFRLGFHLPCLMTAKREDEAALRSAGPRQQFKWERLILAAHRRRRCFTRGVDQNSCGTPSSRIFRRSLTPCFCASSFSQRGGSSIGSKDSLKLP